LEQLHAQKAAEDATNNPIDQWKEQARVQGLKSKRLRAQKLREAYTRAVSQVLLPLAHTP
jgi:hypothetical protein